MKTNRFAFDRNAIKWKLHELMYCRWCTEFCWGIVWIDRFVLIISLIRTGHPLYLLCLSVTRYVCTMYASMNASMCSYTLRYFALHLFHSQMNVHSHSLFICRANWIMQIGYMTPFKFQLHLCFSSSSLAALLSVRLVHTHGVLSLSSVPL